MSRYQSPISRYQLALGIFGPFLVIIDFVVETGKNAGIL